jgi:DNA-binding response OmpR family regulator
MPLTSSPSMLKLSTQPVPIILVVEGEALVRMTLADVLQGAGFQVVEAARAEDAMYKLGAGA